MRNIARNAHALVLNLALCARVDSDDCASDGGFSRTGFADEGERFAFIDVERRVFDCFYSLVALAESDVNVLDRQQNFSAVFVKRTLFGERIHAVFVLVDLRFPVVADALKVSLDFSADAFKPVADSLAGRLFLRFFVALVARRLLRGRFFYGGFLLLNGFGCDVFDMLLLLHCEFLFDGRGVIQCGGLDIVDYFVFVHHSTSSILNALSNLP